MKYLILILTILISCSEFNNPVKAFALESNEGWNGDLRAEVSFDHSEIYINFEDTTFIPMTYYPNPLFEVYLKYSNDLYFHSINLKNADFILKFYIDSSSSKSPNRHRRITQTISNHDTITDTLIYNCSNNYPFYSFTIPLNYNFLKFPSKIFWQCKYYPQKDSSVEIPTMPVFVYRKEDVYKPQIGKTQNIYYVGNPFNFIDKNYSLPIHVYQQNPRTSAPIIEYYWDINADSIFDDTTDSNTYYLNSSIANNQKGTLSNVIVCAKNSLGLVSEPLALPIQLGVNRPIEMISLPTDTFILGKVSLGSPLAHIDSFEIMNTEITNEQYHLIISDRFNFNKEFPELPMTEITWFDAVIFCNELSKFCGFDTCYTYKYKYFNGISFIVSNDITCNFTQNGYRLPTSAEWEYACKGGTTSKYFWSDKEFDTLTANSFCWNSWNSQNEIKEVGLKSSNQFNLYDMSGNVFEWVNDWYNYTIPNDTLLINPKGPVSGSYKEIRGGSISSATFRLKSHYRTKCIPDSVNVENIGFRIVRSLVNN